MDMSTPLLLQVAPEIDTNPTSIYRRVGPVKVRTFDSPVGSIRSTLAMSVHPTHFDLATPLPPVPLTRGEVTSSAALNIRRVVRAVMLKRRQMMRHDVGLLAIRDVHG